MIPPFHLYIYKSAECVRVRGGVWCGVCVVRRYKGIPLVGVVVVVWGSGGGGVIMVKRIFILCCT